MERGLLQSARFFFSGRAFLERPFSSSLELLELLLELLELSLSEPLELLELLELSESLSESLSELEELLELSLELDDEESSRERFLDSRAFASANLSWVNGASAGVQTFPFPVEVRPEARGEALDS
mmetsp:Transcript_6190/g.15277  ORF Transcript_6190/g.15277 Transcript_6190/m.15277 type:complete len:126 (-) Transcript_6190:258-635(-)